MNFEALDLQQFEALPFYPLELVLIEIDLGSGSLNLLLEFIVLRDEPCDLFFVVSLSSLCVHFLFDHYVVRPL